MWFNTMPRVKTSFWDLPMTPEEDAVLRTIHSAGNEVAVSDVHRLLQAKGCGKVEISMCLGSLEAGGYIIRGFCTEIRPSLPPVRRDVYLLTGTGLSHVSASKPVEASVESVMLTAMLWAGLLFWLVGIVADAETSGDVGALLLSVSITLMIRSRYIAWRSAV